MVRMEWQRASFLWKASGKHGNTSLPLSHKSTKVSTSLDEDLLMFVALPFLIFMRRSLYYLAYTTRVPVCYLTGLPVHYCGWSALSPDLPAGAFTGCALGCYRRLWRIRINLLGLSPALSERGAWIWRRQVPCCLRGVALLGNTAVTGFPCRHVGLWQVWRRATGER